MCFICVALENMHKYPNASKVILNCFYVDDLLTGTFSVKDAIQLKNEIIEILNEYGFPLRNFYSNKPEVLHDCAQGQLEQYDITDDKTCKTLGLFWKPKSDILAYSVNLDSHDSTNTKRQILSIIAKVFDPLQLISPTLLKMKLIIQKLWQNQTGWDESVSMEIYDTLWKYLYQQLPVLNNLKIPRQVTSQNFLKLELHGFSEIAYAAVIYLVSVDPDGSRI